MIRIMLTDDEVTRLEQAFRTGDNLRVRPRAQAVLMASRGRPHPQIAQDLAVNQHTLQRWLNAHNRGGLDALVPGKAKGATPKLTADLVYRPGLSGQDPDATHAAASWPLTRSRLTWQGVRWP